MGSIAVTGEAMLVGRFLFVFRIRRKCRASLQPKIALVERLLQPVGCLDLRFRRPSRGGVHERCFAMLRNRDKVVRPPWRNAASPRGRLSSKLRRTRRTAPPPCHNRHIFAAPADRSRKSDRNRRKPFFVFQAWAGDSRAKGDQGR